jgi:hypothetical protein
MLRQLLDTLAELVEDRLFPISQFIEINLRRSEFDAALRGRLVLTKRFSGVEKSLRGDATDVETNPAEPRVLLDQRDLLAFVRRVEGGCVSTWAGAQN